MLETTCPHCGRRNRLHLSTRRGAGPTAPGNVSICIGCHRGAVYETGPCGLQLRLPTADELAAMEANPYYQRAVEKLRSRQPADRAPAPIDPR
jgi:hypothetical protein